jgi:hypothetical protein
LDDYLERLRQNLEQELGLFPAGPGHVRPVARDRISLIITKEQREKLREHGFSEEEIRTMTPDQAHAHLGVK